MIRLATTSDKLQAVLGGVVTTNELQCVVSFSDHTSSGYSGSAQRTNTNGTTDVDICSAPAASTIRDIDFIGIYNNDTASATVTIKIDVSGTEHILQKITLATGEALTYTHGSGWQAHTTAGKHKVETSSGYAPGGTDVALADGGTGASLADPNADRILFWDDSSGAVTWLTAGSGLTITDTTITAVLESSWTDYSATSTIVGWSSFTTKQIYYKDIGKTRFVTFILQGTSNSTSVTFTLPSASHNSVPVLAALRAINNGTDEAIGLTYLPENGSTVTCYRSALAAWTNSGTKQASGQFTYQLP